MKTCVAALLAIVVLFSALSAGKAEAGALKIAAAAWPGYAPAHVAAAKGFWKAEGLDAAVVTPSNPSEVFHLFKGRLVDIAFDMLGSVVQYRMDGIPAVILAETDWSHGGDKIVVRRNISTKDIGRMPVGLYLNTPAISFFLGKYLSGLDMRPADFRLIEMPPDELAQHFIDGMFGVAVLFDPFAASAVRKGQGRVEVSSAAFPGCIPEGVVAMADTVDRIDPADLDALFRGWIRAVEWSRNPANWSAYADILNTRTFSDEAPFPEDDLVDLTSAVRIHDRKTLLERNRDDGGLFAYLAELKSFLRENDLLVDDFSVRDLVRNKAILTALKSETP